MRKVITGNIPAYTDVSTTLKIMARLLLYTKDVQAFTGKSERASRELIKKIKNNYNKQPDEPLTVVEFCNYIKVPITLVWEIIK